MSALTDATNIAALSNALHTEARAATPNINKMKQLTQKLCDDLTAALETYGPGAGIDPSDFPTVIQGGGVPKSV